MPNVGELIWISVRPLVKVRRVWRVVADRQLIIPTLAGFALARAGQFPESSVKSTAYLTVNVTLPALLVNKISVAINSGNVGSIGVIVLSGLTCTCATLRSVLTAQTWPSAESWAL